MGMEIIQRFNLKSLRQAVSKKHTIKFIRKQFEAEGYILLSGEYIDNKTLLEYICPKGDYGTIKWNNFQQGQRCAKCKHNKKLTIKFIKKEFKKEGYVLLTNKYINAKQKLKYICPTGHKWDITWDKWQQGKRCKKCYLENKYGSNNPNYNPNLTDEERLHKRDYLDYTKWCLAVKEKYNFTCVICKQIGGQLVSHHLESYNSNPDLRTVLNNGVCLCEECHKKFHYQYGYGNNTKVQFEEFVSRRIK